MLDLIASGINIAPALFEIEARPVLWSLFTARQTAEGSPHHDTECIVLRGPAVPDLDSVFTDLIAHDYPVIYALTNTIALLRNVLETHLAGATIGRVMIVKLKAGGEIDSHSDEGPYAEWYTSRLHLVLTSSPANVFQNGDDYAQCAPGELWAFDHRIVHSYQNHSDRDRIHIIIDARKEGIA